MKQIFPFLIASLLLTSPALRAQTPDAAAAIADKQAEEERYKRLNSLVEDLQTALQASQAKQAELAKRVASLEDHQLKQSGNSYASTEDLKKLGENIVEVDRKRMEDNKKVADELAKILKAAADSASKTAKPSVAPKPPAPATNTAVELKADPQKKGFEYVVQKNDNLTAIAAAYRQKNIKVTVDDILKANPGLVPETMRIGQKIFIPEP